MPTRPRWTWLARFTGTLAAGALMVYVAFRLDEGDLPMYTRMGLAAIVAVGLSLLMGFAGQISLGQGAFYALGAYTTGILSVGLRPADRLVNPEAAWDPLFALAAAPILTGAVAAVVGVPLLRLRGHYLAFATLALHLILLAALFAEDRFTGGQDPGLVGIPQLEVRGHVIEHARLAAVVWGIVALSVIMAVNLVGSRAGRALQAIATSEATAAAAGINVAMYKLRLFVLAAGLAGLAGGLFSYYLLFLSPDAFPLITSITFVVMVAVGGMGSVYGAVVGAIAITYLEDKLRELGTREQLLGFDLPVQAPQVFSIGVFGAILIVVMLFAPRGLLPSLQVATRAVARRLRRRTQAASGAA
ncbi:MAG: branched-chain amino acid ABC transporter permease [Actinobacteria bacterium]|nr:branched-chain amino acid ABC transporter permease [Actinomycetota bacterium]